MDTPSESADAPFLDGYLLYLLARASSVASSQFHAALARQGISVPTWRVLAVLSDGPATVGQLAEAVLLKQATLSKALDRLERDGLVRRQRRGADRRQVTVALTDAGAGLARDLIPQAMAHQQALLAPYDEGETQALIGVLKDFIAMAGKAP